MLPRVALETTVLSHGLPWPANEHLARALVVAVASRGAEGVFAACVGGDLRCDLSLDDLQPFCRPAPDTPIAKTTLATLPGVLAHGVHGATTVATTMLAAHRAGIPVMATGGIGGVHLRAQPSDPLDESGDLQALSRIPVTVVCAGPKAVLDVAATRERLETLGIPVVGYGTDSMPAFYCGSSPHGVDIRCDTPEDVASVIRARDAAGLSAAILVVVPLPEEDALPWDTVQKVVTRAMQNDAARRLSPPEVTPYLLSAVRDALGDAALSANVRLLERNAAVAAEIAAALSPSTP